MRLQGHNRGWTGRRAPAPTAEANSRSRRVHDAEIEMAYDVVDKALPERTLVVIDSVDALAEKYGVPRPGHQRAPKGPLWKGAVRTSSHVLETPDPLLDYLGTAWST